MARLATDVAGGLLGTLPSAGELDDPEVGPYIKKVSDRCSRRRSYRSSEGYASHREPGGWIGSSRLPDRIDAWRGVTYGPTDYDRSTGECGGEDGSGEADIRDWRIRDLRFEEVGLAI